MNHPLYYQEWKLHVRNTYPNSVSRLGFQKRIERGGYSPEAINKAIYTPRSSSKKINFGAWNRGIKKTWEQSERLVGLKAVYKRIRKGMDLFSAIHTERIK